MTLAQRRRTVFADPPRFAQRSGLISFWRFGNGGAPGQDSWGTNHLTDGGVLLPGGLQENGIRRNGSNVLSIASNSSLQIGSGDFWLSLWSNRDPGGTSFVGPLGKVGTSGTTASQVEWQVFLSAGIVRFYVSNGTSFNFVTATGGAGSGVWLHTFFWRNAATGILYSIAQTSAVGSNGSTVYATNSTTLTISPQSADFPFSIGKAGDTGLYSGVIDEVCFGKMNAGELGDNVTGYGVQLAELLYNKGMGLKRVA